MRGTSRIILVLAFGSLVTGDVTIASGTRMVAERPAVAVLWFEDQTGDTDAACWRYGAASLLQWSLVEAREIRMISLESGDVALRLRQLKAGSELQPELVQQIGEQMAAQYVVWGAYQKNKQCWKVSVRVLTVDGGKQSPLLKANACDWYEIRDRLTDQILKQIPVKVTSQQRRKMRERGTKSARALALFSQATRWLL